MLLTLFKRKCVFLCLSNFLETEITWSQPIIVRNTFPKIRTCVSRHVNG